jgi:hypothetical protein
MVAVGVLKLRQPPVVAGDRATAARRAASALHDEACGTGAGRVLLSRRVWIMFRAGFEESFFPAAATADMAAVATGRAETSCPVGEAESSACLVLSEGVSDPRRASGSWSAG